MRNYFSVIVLVSVVAALLLAACGGSAPQESTVEISEAQFNESITFNDAAALTEATVDVTTAGVVLSGTLTCPDDSTEDGSVTIVMSTTDVGLLSVAVSNVEAECLVVDDASVTQVGGAVATVVDEVVRGGIELSEGETIIGYQSVTFTDDSVTLVVTHGEPPVIE